VSREGTMTKKKEEFLMSVEQTRKEIDKYLERFDQYLAKYKADGKEQDFLQLGYFAYILHADAECIVDMVKDRHKAEKLKRVEGKNN
jgi:uncharacterized protein YutE (UPF0331/DUF86 family)